MILPDLKKGETQIVYFNGEERKVVTGRIVEETDEYILLERERGNQKIFKRWIVDTFEKK